MLLVSRTAIASGRANGFAVIAGICASGAIWVTSSALGLKALFALSPVLHDVVATAGALYLIWLGVKLLRAKRSIDTVEDVARMPEPIRSSFVKGFVANITNPKTLVYFSSVFGAFLPAGATASTIIAVVLITWFCNHVWYGSLTLLLSSATARRFYSKLGVVVDRVAGAVMVFFGLRLLTAKQ
jgi:threonine efflux protein